MSIADLPIADQIAVAGGRKVRRYMNEPTYRAALRQRADENSMHRFMCECGHLDCPELIALRLVDFDERSRPGTIVVADHEAPYPDRSRRTTRSRRLPIPTRSRPA
jgi:hypothetical protein